MEVSLFRDCAGTVRTQWYKARVSRLGATFGTFFLLACIAAAVVGLSAACSTGCDEPFSDCAGLCLDCACCPNGVSTSVERASVMEALVALSPAFPSVAEGHVDAPPGDILHVPRPVLF